jgi:hypothetical protein
VTPRLTVGVETHPEIREVLPRATWFVTPATERTPSVAFGVTSDRLSTPEGQAYFLTFAKPVGDGRLTPFVSTKYSSADRMIAFPFGASLQAGHQVTLQVLNDGNYTHFLATRPVGQANVTVMLARMRHLGVAVSVGF